jgi:protoporphyrinogen oxidase
MVTADSGILSVCDRRILFFSVSSRSDRSHAMQGTTPKMCIWFGGHLMPDKVDVLIIGAGPSGCAAACVLADAGVEVAVIDKHGSAGGLARTVTRKGNSFDIGPHRFFTKSGDVLQVWRTFLGQDLTSVDRLTRILYRGKLFNYPLSPLNALMGLGLKTSIRAGMSFTYLKLKRSLHPRVPKSVEEWVSDNFGLVIYEAFFKHYTEKVWGIPCSEISADWASQRMKGLHLAKAVVNALFKHRTSNVKTLVNRFLYPKFGSGMLYANMLRHVRNRGGAYIPHATAERIILDEDCWVVEYLTSDGSRHSKTARHVLSSATLSDLIAMLDPKPPEEVVSAAATLKYRNHYGVNLVVKHGENIFPDNWIYVHSPDVHMGRIANYANFSKAMQYTHEHFPVTVEFFSSPGDKVSSLDDAGRIDLAVRELRHTGLMSTRHIVDDPFVIFSRAAYPVMEIGYEHKVRRVRRYLDDLTNLQTMGRAGMFQYNNQDHSIMTGLLAARNILGDSFDLWCVNSDAEYLESGTAPDLCDRDRDEGMVPDRSGGDGN